MINLEKIVISNDRNDGMWEIVGHEDELEDLVRLARLGLWAEAHAIPALEKLKALMLLTREIGHDEDGMPFVKKEESRSPAADALADLPKRDRIYNDDEEAQG